MQENYVSYFQRLYERYAAPVVRYIYRHVGDAELAEDLMQETFLTALVKLDDVRQHPEPLAWLFRTAWNITMREMEKNRHHISLADMDDIPAQTETSLTELLPRDLSPDEVWLLERYYKDEWSVAELSRYLGITQSACKMRLLRLREKVKVLLAGS